MKLVFFFFVSRSSAPPALTGTTTSLQAFPWSGGAEVGQADVAAHSGRASSGARCLILFLGISIQRRDRLAVTLRHRRSASPGPLVQQHGSEEQRRHASAAATAHRKGPEHFFLSLLFIILLYGPETPHEHPHETHTHTRKLMLCLIHLSPSLIFSVCV